MRALFRTGSFDGRALSPSWSLISLGWTALISSGIRWNGTQSLTAASISTRLKEPFPQMNTWTERQLCSTISLLWRPKSVSIYQKPSSIWDRANTVQSWSLDQNNTTKWRVQLHFQISFMVGTFYSNSHPVYWHYKGISLYKFSIERLVFEFDFSCTQFTLLTNTQSMQIWFI